MPIDHVVVLCLENRSFDHMLGYLPHPDPRFEGLRSGRHENPGWDGAAPVAASTGAKRVLPIGPDHSHDAVLEQLGLGRRWRPWRPTNDGFVRSYERHARGLAPPRFGGLLAPLIRLITERSRAATGITGRGPLAMLCQAPERVPVLSTLALQFAVCDHWFCSVPGETWPNRNYLHAATSDGETDIELRPYTDRTIFELLESAGRRWRIYHDDTPQVWVFPKLWDSPARHGNWFATGKFAEHVGRGDLADYSFIEPNHRPPLHTLDHQVDFGGTPDQSSSQHPENNLVSDAAYDTFDDSGVDTDFARGEALIASIYEALRANPALFATTMLVITYDEHGGLYDHVPPPADVPAPAAARRLLGAVLHALWHRQAVEFDFTMLGPRVPAVIVSPLIPAGTLLSEVHDHASVPATLRALFASSAAPLTARDAWASPFHEVASLPDARLDLPDLSRYTVPQLLRPEPTSIRPADAPGQGSTVDDAPERIPPYYQEFLAQAELVRRSLVTVGEPEVQSLAPTVGIRSGTDITEAFQQAAHRHRHAADPH